MRHFGCMGLLDWEDRNTKLQLESPPASWASLNLRQIPSSQCSTAHQHLKDSSVAVSGTGGRSVSKAAELHKSNFRSMGWDTKVWSHTECTELNRSDNPLDYSWIVQKSGWAEHLAALQAFWMACWGSCMPLWRPNRYLMTKRISKTSKRCAVN